MNREAKLFIMSAIEDAIDYLNHGAVDVDDLQRDLTKAEGILMGDIALGVVEHERGPRQLELNFDEDLDTNYGDE